MKFSFIVTINTCMQHKWEKCSPLHLIYFFRPVNACAQLNVYRGLRNQYHEVCFIYYFKLNDVCLFGFFPLTWEFFTHMETSTLPVKGFKFLTYAWQSLPLSSEGSLACNTYCDTRHPFKMVISEDPSHSHLFPSVLYWGCHYLL